MTNFKISGLTARDTTSNDHIRDSELILLADASTQNYKVTFADFNRLTRPGTQAAPSITFEGSFTTGIYQSAANEIGFSVSDSDAGRFTSDGFQVGPATGTAKFQVFSDNATDDVIFENTLASAVASPNIVLHRNKADVSNVADGDSLGQIIFRGDDDGNNATSYANILCVAKDVSNAAEKGSLEFKTVESSTSATRMSIVGSKVGINTTDPQQKLHVTDTTVTNQARLECNNADTSTVGGGLELYRHTNGNGGANDKLSTIEFDGNDSAGNKSTFGRVSSTILTATSGSEGGQVSIDIANSTQSGQLDAKLVVNENRVQALSTLNIPTGTPSSSSAAGTAGDIVWDSAYLYVCVSSNSWKRVALSTF